MCQLFICNVTLECLTKHRRIGSLRQLGDLVPCARRERAPGEQRLHLGRIDADRVGDAVTRQNAGEDPVR
jgi:hypothetical protein